VKEALFNAEARFGIRVCEEAEARGGSLLRREGGMLENGT
jgi:hypothetical protein